jgi:arsenate reductase
MDAIIYHNPNCETSRNTLALIRNAGAILDLLPPQRSEFFKGDGERVIDERGRRPATA